MPVTVGFQKVHDYRHLAVRHTHRTGGFAVEAAAWLATGTGAKTTAFAGCVLITVHESIMTPDSEFWQGNYTYDPKISWKLLPVD